MSYAPMEHDSEWTNRYHGGGLMRILHISTRLIVGGSQENTILSCEGQSDLGHEVHLAFGPIYGPEGSLLERAESFHTDCGRSIRCHEIPHMFREISPVRDLQCVNELRSLIKELQPDIVHTHSSKAGVLGRFAAWREGGKTGRIGVVHTIHGPPFHKYEKKWRNFLYVEAEIFAAKHCHLIVGVAQSMNDQFLKAKIGKPDQYRVVYSGMETEPFLNAGDDPAVREHTRNELGLSSTDTVIGAVARLAELKGHDDLLDAIGDDLKSNPNLKLLWVGDGWWRERLEKRLSDMHIREQVVLTGLVPPERVPAMMSAMDLLVHASYREGLPRTVPQALLTGIPVVANDVDGTREACIDQTTGRLAQPGEIESLREAIHWMLDDPDRARQTAQAGRDLCRDRFDHRTMVNELEKVYADALA